MVGTGELDCHSESVVDHLILGKPLPPCTLPSCSRCTEGRGIALRYQIENCLVKFLQTVKLNGILADEWAGKTLQALVGMAITQR
jgi:SNF2 family DNA or RNA helicase